MVFNYLTTPNDRREWVEAVRTARHILNQPAFAPYNDGELSPGPRVESDEEILDWVREDAETALHPSCTAAMGVEEIRSVNVNYRDLVNDIAVGDTVLVDNGLIRLEVLEKNDTRIRCRVLIPGQLSSRRHINLPGVKVNLPAAEARERLPSRSRTTTRTVFRAPSTSGSLARMVWSSITRVWLARYRPK